MCDYLSLYLFPEDGLVLILYHRCYTCGNEKPSFVWYQHSLTQITNKIMEWKEENLYRKEYAIAFVMHMKRTCTRSLYHILHREISLRRIKCLRLNIKTKEINTTLNEMLCYVYVYQNITHFLLICTILCLYMSF
jgi:hypothetical protein